MTISEVIRKEAELEAITAQMKSDIVEAVETAQPLDGVKPIEGAGLNCFTVQFSTICKQPTLNLSSEYYSQISQSAIVNRALASYSRATDIVARVENMIEEEQVVVNKEKYALNPSTIKALQTALGG